MHTHVRMYWLCIALTYIRVSEDSELQNELYNGTSYGEKLNKVPDLLEIVLGIYKKERIICRDHFNIATANVYIQ